MIGAVDPRLPATWSAGDDDQNPALVAEAAVVPIEQVRWPVLEGVWGEGLLLSRTGGAAFVVALPDADQTPEQICGLAPGLPRGEPVCAQLAENGCEVLLPV